MEGPALIIDATATIAVEPFCTALITTEHVVGFVQDRTHEEKHRSIEDVPEMADPILLSVFGHRFMTIAEQMGRTLQKTSISTNIKERLDFSCALFGPDGGLVANAPHIPVHLGSMQEAVRWQIRTRGPELQEGQVILTNHPVAGGSHLPDMTVITPVFDNHEIVFFVASRGHHADIGGTRPGSMPPDSKELYEEGAMMKSFDLVKHGVFDEAGLERVLVVEPGQYPGCSGSRMFKDNVSDLKAQVAANQKGIELVKALIGEYGLGVVHGYMKFIRENAEIAVREMLKRVAIEKGSVLNAMDKMDDGSEIHLEVRIDETTGKAMFDFGGTGMEVYGNTNAPRSVTYSAVIYCLRSMIQYEMPLNEGALSPVEILIPEGSLLNPSGGAAVVGGNVMTSQRVVDVVLKAFGACAASQGCCNNITFGVDGKGGFGYYETIAGGAGAGPSWDGRSGVHTHMTNTRMTDVEVVEKRYPVLVRKFGLRRGSGGKGKHVGGDGVIRALEFLKQIRLSVLSERRVISPYGMHGGENGKVGRNILIRRNGSMDPQTNADEREHEIRDIVRDMTGRLVNLGGKNAVQLKEGDVLVVMTPGGGGYGEMSNE